MSKSLQKQIAIASLLSFHGGSLKIGLTVTLRNAGLFFFVEVKLRLNLTIKKTEKICTFNLLFLKEIYIPLIKNYTEWMIIEHLAEGLKIISLFNAKSPVNPFHFYADPDLVNIFFFDPDPQISQMLLIQRILQGLKAF